MANKKTPAKEKAEQIAEQDRRRLAAKKSATPAKDGIFSPKDGLEWMNTNFAAITNFGGKFVIYDERAGAEQAEIRLPRELRSELVNKRVAWQTDNGNTKTALIFDWWLKHPLRREYAAAEFYPGGDTEESVKNLWKGWNVAVRSEDGRKQFRPLNPKATGTKHHGFLQYVKDILCNGEEESYKYFYSWMARAIQQPYIPGESAVVLQGPQGAGKTFFSETFGALFGEHAFLFGESGRFLQKFNSILAKCVFLGAEEAYFAGDHGVASHIKNLLTAPNISYERKGIDQVYTRNCIHLVMTSNQTQVSKLEPTDRRHFILSVSDERVRDRDYFGKISRDMAAGGYDSLWRELRNTDISKFDPGQIPMTRARELHIIYSLDPVLEFWWSVITNGGFIVKNEKARGPEVQLLFLYGDAEAVWEMVPMGKLFGDQTAWHTVYEGYRYFCNERKYKFFSSQEKFKHMLKMALPPKSKTVSGSRGGAGALGGRLDLPSRKECEDAFRRKVLTPYIKRMEEKKLAVI